MYAVIDTETTGLMDYKRPADAEGQPRVASFAMITVDDDLRIRTANAYYIKPDGWSMPPEAGEINGLTDEFLHDVGIPIQAALDVYRQAILNDYVITSFGAQFDCKMMRAEFRRLGLDDLFEQTRNICLMRAMTPICKLPKKRGGGYKFPKLSEACQHLGLFNPDAHSALGDAMVATQILMILHGQQLLPEPSVHYAKNKAAIDAAR